MKIAVASDKGIVSEHFGHCEGFEIYEVEGKQISNKNFIPNPGHRPGFLPNYLNDLRVSVVISGGMGAGAIEIFNEKGVEVVTGASGKTEDVVKQYLKGELRTSGSTCHHD